MPALFAFSFLIPAFLTAVFLVEPLPLVVTRRDDGMVMLLLLLLLLLDDTRVFSAVTEADNVSN